MAVPVEIPEAVAPPPRHPRFPRLSYYLLERPVMKLKYRAIRRS